MTGDRKTPPPDEPEETTDEASERPILKTPPPPKGTKSGEHPAIVSFRKKLDSYNENMLPHLDRLNDRMEEMKNEVSTPPPPSGAPPSSKPVLRSPSLPDLVADDEEDDFTPTTPANPAGRKKPPP